MFGTHAALDRRQPIAYRAAAANRENWKTISRKAAGDKVKSDIESLPVVCKQVAFSLCSHSVVTRIAAREKL